MDTKWKKSKTVISVLCHVAGISFLGFAVMFNPYFAFHAERGDMKQIVSGKGRYELTEDFRASVSGMLNDLILVGADRPVWDGTWEDVQTYGTADDFWSIGDSGEQTIVVAEEVTLAEVPGMVAEAAEGSFADETGTMQQLIRNFFVGQESGQTAIVAEGRELSREEIEKQRKEFLDSHCEDRNLLYEVITTDSQGTPCVYSNEEGLSDAGSKERLREKYSFWMEFDGEKASAWLEGEELELYGSGIYTWDDAQWGIPGYENYKLSDDFKRSKITIAVRREPERYVVNGTVYGGSLYRISRSLRMRQRVFRIWVASCAGAAVLLAISIRLHKSRLEVKRAIGRKLGRVPVELMLLLCAGVQYAGYMRIIYVLFWGYGGGGLELYGIGLLCFWVLYLLGVYFRYGNNPWKNSLLKRLQRFWGKREFRMEIQERMAARAFRPLCFLAASIGLAAIACLCEYYDVLPEYGPQCLFGLAAAALLITVLLLFSNTFRQWRLAADLGHLSDEIDAAYEGEERDAFELPENSDLADMAKKVAGIREGLEEAVEERMKSERMKVELVANVSHDIKTPLTSIISYVDLLKEDDSLPDELKDYVAILAQKSERLKEMVQDVFEVSKASSGQLPIQMEKLDLAKLLKQTMADMQEQIGAAPVSVRAQIPEEAVGIWADGQRLYRVFQNLLQNALQYSLEGSRIYVKLEKKENLAVVSVRNMSKDELTDEIDFTGRFVRGDASRTDGGSGLGLSIAKSFTEACGGTFQVETIADLFVVTVEFALEDGGTG